MPFNKVDTTIKSKEYLNNFLNIKDQVLSTYKSKLNEIIFSAPGWEGRLPQPQIKGWRMTHLFFNGSSTKRDNIKLFDEIKNAFNNLPKGVYVVASGILEAYPNIEESWHKEPHPKQAGFKRYHIPLVVSDDWALGVKEDDGEKHYHWEVGSIFEFENPGNEHQVMFLGDNKNTEETRIVWVIDILENNSLNEQQIGQAIKYSSMVSSGGICWDKEVLV